MESISFPTQVHRTLVVELIRTAPTSILDDILAAMCTAIARVNDTELGNPTQVERAGRVVRAFGPTVHMPAVVYDALDCDELCALVVLCLDQLAIDARPEQVGTVVAAASYFIDAVSTPVAVVIEAGAAERGDATCAALSGSEKA